MQDRFTQEWNRFNELVLPIIEGEKQRAWRLKKSVSDDQRLYLISQTASYLGLIHYEINKNRLSLVEKEKAELADKLQSLNTTIEQHKILLFLNINFEKILDFTDEKVKKLGIGFIFSLTGLITGILLATLLVTTTPWVFLPIGVAVVSFLGLTATVGLFSTSLALAIHKGLFANIESAKRNE